MRTTSAPRSMEGLVAQWEEVLQKAWLQANHLPLAEHPAAMSCFGRLAVRTTLFLVKKERSGPEGFEYESLDAIWDMFETEMGCRTQPSSAAVAAPTESALLADLGQQRDPHFFLQLDGFEVGRLYKGKQKLTATWPWKLVRLDVQAAVFELQNPVANETTQEEVPFASVKKCFDKFQGEAPDRLTHSETVPFLAHNSQLAVTDRLRCELFLLLQSELAPKLAPAEEALTYLRNPSMVFLSGKSAGKKTLLCPYTDSVTRISTRKGAGSAEARRTDRDVTLYISAPARNDFLSAFWATPAAKGTQEPANLAYAWLKLGSWRLQVLRNEDALKECFLYKPSSKEREEADLHTFELPAAKRAKAA